MLEGGSSNGGQSLLPGARGAESRRWCSCCRLRSAFVCVLVLVVGLFLYSTNLRDVNPDWNFKVWVQNQTARWMSDVYNRTETGSQLDPPGPGSTSAAGSTATSSSSSSSSSNLTSAPSNASVATPQPNKTVPPTPVPYVSPGKYLVEYPHEYHFIIDQPKVCEEQKPFLVLMVPVAPHNRADRDTIRATWGGERWVLGKEVMLFFMLGVTSGDGSGDLREEILQESREHRDLIQSDFLDCYKNLTIKTMMILEWLDSHCSGASFAMKIDSDMFLNVPKLVQMLLSAPRKNYLTGLVASGAAVRRDQGSKWYLPYDVYPHSYYPRYALGLGYVLSMDLPKKLVEASRHVRAVYIEDVYLGLCMQHLGIPPTFPPSGGYFQVFPVPYNRCTYSEIIAIVTSEHFDRLWAWKDLKREGPYC